MKQQAIESVVQDWVSTLPFMMQTILLTAIRGADGVSKYSNSRPITRYIRGATLKPIGEIHGNEDNFMWIRWSDFKEYTVGFFNDIDYLPIHFFEDVMHVAEVIGYEHPDPEISDYFTFFYWRACNYLHVNLETIGEMRKRLTEKTPNVFI